MRIDKLIVKNFKCFSEFEMTLDPGVNIIFGVNGVGKTSILEALSVAAGSFFLGIAKEENKQVQLSEVRLETKLAKLEYQSPVLMGVNGYVLKRPYSIYTSYSNLDTLGWTRLGDVKSLREHSFRAAEIVRDGLEIALPVITFFSCKRLFNESTNGSPKPIGRLMGYYNALNDRSIRKEVDNWFNDEATKAFNAKENGLPGDPYKNLKVMYGLLLSIFPDKFTKVYYYKPESDDRLTSGLFFADAAGTITSLQMMSDGYRNTVHLIMEIAWRCLQLNGFLGTETFKETEGIVLVDEVDLHLHPALQQRIVGLLKDNFPKIQFVLTTHSPLILGSAESTAWKLEEGQLIRQPKLFGKDASYIVRNFMGAPDRAPEIEDKIKQYFDLINQHQGKSTLALQLRSELETVDENLMAEADVLIKFLED
jgi:predicted ATP-binding protein involved in virulence